MQITRTKLEARLAELKASLDNIKQQFALTTGAIADIEHWLAEEAKPEPEPEADAPNP